MPTVAPRHGDGTVLLFRCILTCRLRLFAARDRARGLFAVGRRVASASRWKTRRRQSSLPGRHAPPKRHWRCWVMYCSPDDRVAPRRCRLAASCSAYCGTSRQFLRVKLFAVARALGLFATCSRSISTVWYSYGIFYISISSRFK